MTEEGNQAHQRQIEKLQGELYQTVAISFPVPEQSSTFVHDGTRALAAVLLERDPLDPIVRQEAIYQFSEALMREVRKHSNSRVPEIGEITAAIDAAVRHYQTKLRQRP